MQLDNLIVLLYNPSIFPDEGAIVHSFIRVALFVIAAAAVFAIEPSYEEYIFLSSSGYGEVRIHVTTTSNLGVSGVEALFSDLKNKRPALALSYYATSLRYPLYHHYATISFSRLEDISALPIDALPFLGARTFSLTSTNLTNIFSIILAPLNPEIPSSVTAPIITNLSDELAERLAARRMTNYTVQQSIVPRTYMLEVILPWVVNSNSTTNGTVITNGIRWELPYTASAGALYSVILPNDMVSKRKYRVFQGESSFPLTSVSVHLTPVDFVIFEHLKTKKNDIFKSRYHHAVSCNIRKKDIARGYCEYEAEIVTAGNSGGFEKWHVSDRFRLE
ncbi:MAG: hypothetical protein HZC28_07635 [Spirochaetes bacterium]|nr:hypothetical protein [Spirochaetota bacterium]